MKFEFKGRHFLEISIHDLIPLAQLRCDVFLYLALNGKMLKIRDRNHFLEAEALATYARGGRAKFFILDPSANEGAYEFPTDASQILNPKIPAEFLPKLSETKLDERPALALVEGELKSQAPNLEQPGEVIVSKESANEELGKVLPFTSKDEDFGKAITASKEASAQKTQISPDQAEKEAEQNFSADKAEKEPEQKFDADSAFADDETNRWQPGQEESHSTRIGADIDELEESLAQFSPDGKKFVEELKRISAGEGEEANGPSWRVNLGEDSPELAGLPREAAAAAKLSFTLANSLGKLRKELRSALGEVPQGKEEMAALVERRKALRDQIQKMENTSVLLEALDYSEGDLADLPQPFAQKTRKELIAELEQNLESMRGSNLLDEKTQATVEQKIKKVKAREAPAFEENVRRLAERLHEQKKKMHSDEALLDANDLAEFNRALAKEAKAARLVRRISDSTTDLRNELAALLAEKPQNAGKQKENEERAAKLLREIRELEDAALLVDAGEEPPADVVKRFARSEEAEAESDKDFIVLKAGEPAEQGIEQALKKMEAMKEAVTKAKEKAATAKAHVTKVIRGESKKPLEADPKERVHLAAEKVARLDKARELVIVLKGNPISDAEKAHAIQSTVMQEIERSHIAVNIENKLAAAQRTLSELLRRKPADALEKAELEEQTMLLQEDIQELRLLRDSVNSGDSIESERLDEYRFTPESTVPELRRSIAKGDMAEVLESIDSLKLKAVLTHREVQSTGEDATTEAEASDFIHLKQKMISPIGIDAVKKKLSRHLKKFLEAGKTFDSEAIWNVNQIVSKEVQLAKANINVAKALAQSAKDLAALQKLTPGSEAERAEIEKKIEEKKREVQELARLSQALERGEAVSEEKLKPFLEEVEPKFVISADSSIPETITRITGSLDELKQEFITIKTQAMEATRETRIKGGGGSEVESVTVIHASSDSSLDDSRTIREHVIAAQAADEAFKEIVSNSDDKGLQAGVCAATLFRSFGYHDKELEHDLITACYLWDYSGEEVQNGFSDRVLAVHRASKEQQPGDEMILRDLGQAVRMARGYTSLPDVITGRISVDPKIFSSYCEKIAEASGPETDLQLIERARQGMLVGMPRTEWESLIDLTKYVRQKLDHWKQGRPA